MKKQKMIRSLEIALDILDRVDGTKIYEIQKKTMGFTDAEYIQMLEGLSVFYLKLRLDSDGKSEDEL